MEGFATRTNRGVALIEDLVIVALDVNYLQ